MARDYIRLEHRWENRARPHNTADFRLTGIDSMDGEFRR